MTQNVIDRIRMLFGLRLHMLLQQFGAGIQLECSSYQFSREATNVQSWKTATQPSTDICMAIIRFRMFMKNNFLR